MEQRQPQDYFDYRPQHEQAPSQPVASSSRPPPHIAAWPPHTLSSLHHHPPPLATSPEDNSLAAHRPSNATPSAPKLSVVSFLETLDLSLYIGVFLEEGFDKIESLSDVQESDFEALGIKRGHRRIIQRELLSMRGIPLSTPLNFGGRESFGVDEEDYSSGRESIQQANRNIFYFGAPVPPRASSAAATAASELGAKRRYRRHPKPDPTAPEKPPSAYVEFSNSVRNNPGLKGKTFTEIARLVGEMWQSLDAVEKARLEARAGQAKIRYSALMAEYKKTAEYAEYQTYLAEFRSKHPVDPIPTPNPSPGDLASAARAHAAPTPPPLHSRSSGEDLTAQVDPTYYAPDSGP